MSKKKRNRRPQHAPRPPSGTAGTVTVENPGNEAGLDDAPDDADEAEALADDVNASLVAAAHRATSDADEPAAPPTPGVAPAEAVHSAAAPAAPSWVTHESGDIRGVLIQVGGGRLLLPNATIAEVLSYAEPEAGGDEADWLLGRFRWRGWQLPLVAFSRLAGIGEERPGLGSKVIVLKALGGDRRLPYFAILTQGFPRLVTVSRTALEVEADEADLPAGVLARVRLNDDPALLPDLPAIESALCALRDARDAA